MQMRSSRLPLIALLTLCGCGEPSAVVPSANARHYQDTFAYSVDKSLSASHTQLSVLLDGEKVDEIVSAEAIAGTPATVTAHSKGGGCNLRLELSKDGTFRGQATFDADKLMGSGPFTTGVLNKNATLVSSSRTFKQGDTIVLEFSHATDLPLDVTGRASKPVELKGVVVATVK
jgi:hypothetical protein